MEMVGQCHKLGQLVWAKIVGYPWWPAQIVQHDQPSNSHKIKVLFFGDNSHAYLAPEKLAAYSQKYQECVSKADTNKKLKAAVDLADDWLAQISTKSSDAVSDPTPASSVASDSQPEAPAPVVTQVEPQQQPSEYQLNNQYSQQRVPLDVDTLLEIEINPNNVIQLLEQGANKQLQSAQGYINRKNASLVRQKLELNLLLKYKLNKQPLKNQQAKFREPRPLKISKKPQQLRRKRLAPKPTPQPNRDHLKRLYYLKVYTALKTQQLEKQQARSLSILLVEKLLEGQGFERSYVQALRWIYNNRASDIVTHHWSFLQGLTGKDERLNEDTTASKVSVGVE